MKRFWQACLAVVATAAITGSANAQWNESAEIGSYQSILSRAGYGTEGTQVGYNPAQPVPSPPGAAMAAQHGMVVDQGMAAGGCGSPNCDGGCASGNCGGSVGVAPTDCGCGGACNGSCGGAMMGGRMGGRRRGGMGGRNSVANNSYVDQGYDGGCNSPVYTPGAAIGGGVSNGIGNRLGSIVNGGGGSNRVASLFGMSLRRDYEDGVRLARNGAGDILYSDDVRNGNMNGLGVSIASRGCDGSGWEAIYWGLDEEDDVSLAGPATSTYLTGPTGYGGVAHVPSGATVQDIFDAGDSARYYRDTDINNLEFNLLRNGGQYTTRSGRSGNYELLGGFRLFTFDESFRSVSTSSNAAYPVTIEHRLEAENTLAGFQLGGRNEICLTDRVKFAHAGTAGVFNNRIQTRQQIIDSDGYSALDYADTKDDAAFMGQIDVGLIYQFSQKARARIGYRALGVAGVALAVDQIPADFTNVRELTSAQSNGSLLMHGMYFGSEFCF